SFGRLAEILRGVAAGQRGSAPASIVILSGDVHYAYLAEAEFPGQPVESRVYQAVCSPFRHSLDPPLELANRFAFRRAAERFGALLARSVRLPRPPLAWQMNRGPYFENEVATLELRAREAHLRLDRTPRRELRLDCVADDRLTRSQAGPLRPPS
ncbi:MAG TPA: hypothetical protein VIX82_04355, partial [Solirubrobacteraceae bacterium]